MRLNNKSIQKISSHKYGRFDCKYWNTQDSIPYSDFIPLKDLFEIVNGSVQTSNYASYITSIPYIRIGDIDYKFGISLDEAIYLDEETELPPDRVLRDNDLVLATIGATVGKIGIANKIAGGTHSNNTVVLRAKKDSTNCLFYEKLFQSDYFMKYIYGLVAQKAQPNLQPYEIENIKIPIISAKAMDEAVRQFKPIESKINILKGTSLSVQDVIDSVLQHEFNININKLKEIDTSKRQAVSFGSFSDKNINCRFSYRWNKAVELQNELSNKVDCCQPLGLHILNTQNGWSPACSEDNNSDYQVLGLDAINKSGILSLENPKFSSEYKRDFEKYIISDGDFFVSRGNTTDLVSLASIAFIDEETPTTIYPDLMIKITFDSAIIKMYMAYIINSFIGRFYFKYATKGKNQTMVKVSPRELSDFIAPIPDISIQEKIVFDIQNEIKKQDNIKNQIAELRNQIDNIIMKTIIA